MIAGGTGGATTTKHGLAFEGKTDLAACLKTYEGYDVDEDGNVYFKRERIAQIFKKIKFYNVFLTQLGIDWKKYLSCKLLPDDSIFVIIRNTLYIIECKYQNCAGSVDEKLQTCDFKRKQYKRLLADKNIDVEYIYLLSDWFRNERYRDVLNYIISVNCSYYFDYIPLCKLGLPAAKKKALPANAVPSDKKRRFGNDA